MTAPAPVFIVNHLSETVARKGSVLAKIARDNPATLYDDDIFSQLETIASKTRAQMQDWVFIEGGDGTCQGVLTAFIRAYGDNPLPRFTLVPGGMTNQVAGVIGLKSRKAGMIKRLLNGGGAVRKLPLLKISAEATPDYIGFLFSTGAIPMVTEYTKAKLHQRGIGGSLAVLGGILRGVSGRRSDVMRPTEIAMQANGQAAYARSHLGTVITTLPSLFKGLDPFWNGDGQPIRATIADAHCKRLFTNIMSLWRGNTSKDRRRDGLNSFTTDHIRFEYSGPIVLDGEALTLLPARFSLSATAPVTFLQAK